MNKEEFISDFKSQMQVGFLNATASLQNTKQQNISNEYEHYRLHTFFLKFGELKKKLFYYLYNLDVNS